MLRINKYTWLIVILLSIPAVWALFVSGFYGASDDVHIAWLYEMDQTIRAMKFPPRYVPDLSFGFGYPLFHFVFPLPFYLGETFHLIGLSLVDSIKLVFLLSIPLSMLGMYFLLNEFLGPGLSLAGSVIYAYTPYRSTDIYIRGAIGESFAFVFLPVITLCIIKIFSEEKSWKWPAVLSLSLAGLILTHNIISYMFFPFLLVLIFLMLLGYRKREAILKVAIGIFLGLLSSIYFWLPAIKDSSLMKYSTVFNYLDHFPTLRQLVTPYFGYGASVPGPGDGMSFFLGVLNVLIVLAALIFFLKTYRNSDVRGKIMFFWAFFIFLTSVFMMNHRSSFIWNSIPLVPYFQFPWRFLTLTTFSIPILLVVLKDVKKRNALSLVIILLAIVLNITYFRPADFLGRQDDYYLDRYIPEPSPSVSYLQTQEEYLRLPKDNKERPDKLFPRFFSRTGVDILEVSERNKFDASAKIKVNKETIVNYNKYLFPGWNLEVNGQKVEPFAGEPFGQIAFELSEGVNNVNIYFSETNFNKILDLLSSLALLSSLLMLSGVVKNLQWKFLKR